MPASPAHDSDEDYSEQKQYTKPSHDTEAVASAASSHREENVSEEPAQPDEAVAAQELPEQRDDRVQHSEETQEPTTQEQGSEMQATEADEQHDVTHDTTSEVQREESEEKLPEEQADDEWSYTLGAHTDQDADKYSKYQDDAVAVAEAKERQQQQPQRTEQQSQDSDEQAGGKPVTFRRPVSLDAYYAQEVRRPQPQQQEQDSSAMQSDYNAPDRTTATPSPTAMSSTYEQETKRRIAEYNTNDSNDQQQSGQQQSGGMMSKLKIAAAAVAPAALYEKLKQGGDRTPAEQPQQQEQQQSTQSNEQASDDWQPRSRTPVPLDTYYEQEKARVKNRSSHQQQSYTAFADSDRASSRRETSFNTAGAGEYVPPARLSLSQQQHDTEGAGARSPQSTSMRSIDSPRSTASQPKLADLNEYYAAEQNRAAADARRRIAESVRSSTPPPSSSQQDKRAGSTKKSKKSTGLLGQAAAPEEGRQG